MAIRPCLRCCKGVPETATFCRRCGMSLRDSQSAAGGCEPPPVPNEMPRRGRWPGLILITPLLAAASVLTLFTASIPKPGPGQSWESSPDRNVRVDPADPARLERMREHLIDARQ